MTHFDLRENFQQPWKRLSPPNSRASTAARASFSELRLHAVTLQRDALKPSPSLHNRVSLVRRKRRDLVAVLTL